MNTILEIGSGASYGHGWRQLKKHFAILLAITIVVTVAGLINGGTQEGAFSRYDLLILAYYVLLYGPISYGGALCFTKAARDVRPHFLDLVEGFRDYWNVVFAHVLVDVIIGIGILLFVVPGIIFACRLALTRYLVIDRKMRAMDAMKESWRLTRGRAWTVFAMYLLAIPIMLAGTMLLGVGIVFSMMWIGLAFASLYLAIYDSKEIDANVASMIPA